MCPIQSAARPKPVAAMLAMRRLSGPAVRQGAVAHQTGVFAGLIPEEQERPADQLLQKLLVGESPFRRHCLGFSRLPACAPFRTGLRSRRDRPTRLSPESTAFHGESVRVSRSANVPPHELIRRIVRSANHTLEVYLSIGTATNLGTHRAFSSKALGSRIPTSIRSLCATVSPPLWTVGYALPPEPGEASWGL